MKKKKAVDSESACQFYLEKKKRYCRFKPREGQQYCAEHACVAGVDAGDGRKRIPCPLNPSHNCYEDQLEKHLKKCNVTKLQKQAEESEFYVKNINVDAPLSANTRQITVKELTSQQLLDIIHKVNQLYKEKVQKMERVILEHPCVREEYGEEKWNALSEQYFLKKELLQQCSLVGQLEKLQLLSGENCFVELGAGKGKLSHWVKQACKQCRENSFLLVDRSSVRYKMDLQHRDNTFKRIRVDIADLCLGSISGLHSANSVVVIGKHLCGGATDMGLKCAMETLGRKKISSLTTTSAPSKVTTDAEGKPVSSPNQMSSTTDSAPLGNSSSSATSKTSTEVGVESHNTTPSTNSQSTAPSEEKSTAKVDNTKPLNNPSSQIMESKKSDQNFSTTKANTSQSYSESSEKLTLSSNVSDLSSSTKPGVSATGTDLTGSGNSGSFKNCDHQRKEMESGRCDKKLSSCSESKGDNSSQIDNQEDSEGPPPTKVPKMSLSAEDKKLPKGIMIALCCHHRCDWPTYIGKSFMTDCGVTPHEFDLIARLSSWATCARTRVSRQNKNTSSTKPETDSEPSEEFEEHENPPVFDESMPLRDSLSVKEREEIGRKCKRLIDQGRLEYLRGQGMNCKLHEYIDDAWTPENVVMLAWRDDSSLTISSS